MSGENENIPAALADALSGNARKLARRAVESAFEENDPLTIARILKIYTEIAPTETVDTAAILTALRDVLLDNFEPSEAKRIMAEIAKRLEENQ